jgi:enoyl-CoA hydratase
MEHLIYEKYEQVGVLKINRPHVLNALNSDLLKELFSFLHEVPRKNGLKCLILIGEGEKAFIAGADIKEMQALNHVGMLEFCELGQSVTLALEQMPCATIAAVHGFALGGGLEIALACDFIYASPQAKLGLPEIKLAIIPGFGGTQRLTRAIGGRLAKEMILTGKTITASEAKEMGLINRVCAEGELLKDCLATGKVISSYSASVITQAKQAINHGASLSITDALALERSLCSVCFALPEREEAMNAFVQKGKKEKG